MASTAYQVEVAPVTLPSDSTANPGPTELYLGETFTIAMRSRTGAGQGVYNPNDVWTVIFTVVDSGGAVLEQQTVIGIHSANGLF